MVAFAFSFMIFALFAVIGTGVLVLLRKESQQGDLLLGPALGIAIIAIPTVAINRAGLPVERFGLLLTIVLVALAAYGFWKNGRRSDWKLLVPFGAAVLLAFGLAGWPLLLFDFHWLSYANDDMANYANLAQRVLHHAYYEPPNAAAFDSNKNYPMFYWFMDDLSNERFGVDEVLAWALSLGHLNGFEGFMPTIVAMHMCVVSAAAGLVYRSAAYRPAALLTALLTACSSLLSFGVDYQLVAQSAGLALVACSVAILTSMPLGQKLSRGHALREGALGLIVLAGTSEVYPEVTPFVALPVVGVLLYRILHKTLAPSSVLKWLPGLALGWVVVLNGYIRNFLWVLLIRVIATNEKKDLTHPLLFPFYLIPSGFANFFGLYPLTVYPAEPWLSGGIIAGMLMALLLTYAEFQVVRTGHPVAFVSIVMQVLSVLLFLKIADFGLYKIAMYSQPFMLGTLSIWWCTTWKTRLSVPPRLATFLLLSEKTA